MIQGPLFLLLFVVLSDLSLNALDVMSPFFRV